MGGKTSAVTPAVRAVFAEAMESLGPFVPAPNGGPLCLAISGGADSMALAWLAQDWALGEGIALHGVIVDHGLRPTSGQEARITHERLQAMGISVEILNWQGEKPSTGVQAAAREARHSLLRAASEAAGAQALVTAHHLDDQIETTLMRFGRGSGVKGLAAMRPARRDGETRIMRPLLSVEKKDLVALCQEQGLAWVEDPSNQDPRFTRVRLRQARDDLGEIIAPDGARASLAALRRAEAWMGRMVDEALRGSVRLDAFGAAWIRPKTWASLDPECAAQALSELILIVSGASYGANAEATARLARELAQPDFRGATLHGLRVSPQGKAGIVMAREAQAVAGQTLRLEPGQRGLWDRRFAVSLGSEMDEVIDVRALGVQGWDQVKRQGAPQTLEILRGSSPAFWSRDGQVLAAPCLDWRSEKAPLIRCTFANGRALWPQEG